jgi:hypothetical protein
VPAPPARFFAPTFFSPYYFPSLVAAGRQGSGVSAYRDRDAFVAILAALSATGEFADVFFGTTPDDRAGGADRTPAAVVTPESWTEDDETDPIVFVRRVSFKISLIVRDEDPLTRFDSLDRLSSVVQNALDGTDLGGGCLAALTKMRWGLFDADARHPEQRVVLRGEFAYLISDLDDHNTSS